MQRNNKGVIGGVMAHPASFAGAFVLLFSLSVVMIAAADALPEPIPNEISNGSEPEANAIQVSNPEPPVCVVASAIGLDAPISSPCSTNVPVIDSALLKGAVRYP